MVASLFKYLNVRSSKPDNYEWKWSVKNKQKKNFSFFERSPTRKHVEPGASFENQTGKTICQRTGVPQGLRELSFWSFFLHSKTTVLLHFYERDFIKILEVPCCRRVSISTIKEAYAYLYYFIIIIYSLLLFRCYALRTFEYRSTE